MKLNTRRTVLVGLAFLSICAFWQLYDNVVPLILKNTFHIPDGTAGYIMAIDNVLALFLLPYFGMLSDRSKSRMGKRMPFIVGGSAAAVLLMNLLPLADRRQSFSLFIVALGLLLVAMGTYRSPAVALMPDVTEKPLRSKGNAVINLMGALGGLFTLALTPLLVKKALEGEKADYTVLFAAVGVLMVVCVAVLFVALRGVPPLPQEEEAKPMAQAAPLHGWRAIPPDMRRSLLLILCSVFLWFMGYNAVTTAFTKYAQQMWGAQLGVASQYMMVATVGAVVSYVPVGLLATRFGRKRVIQLGVVLLSICFAVGGLYHSLHGSIYAMFALMGLSWAMVNVNSYPMVVEISKGADVGKFTGYYYTFSMAAQILTPIVSGYLLEHVGYHTLFPYAAVCVACSLVTISLSRHGDSKPKPPASALEAYADEEDAA